MTAREIPVGHRLLFTGLPSNMAAARWHCECGAWECGLPSTGVYGSNSNRAKLARVNAQHASHVRPVLVAAWKTAKGKKP